MSIDPLDPATDALLRRLDAGYEGIDADAPETDPPAWWAFWEDLLAEYGEEDDMTDPLTAYQARIERDIEARDHYLAKAAEATKASERDSARHSAEARERMLAVHQAKVDALVAHRHAQEAA